MKNRGEENIRDIEQQLCWDSSVDTRDIRVTRDERAVRLTGTVPDYADRVHAFRDAVETADGREVINRLSVQFPPDAVLPPDEMLEMNLNDILSLLSWLREGAVKVRVARRQVYLTGQVEYFWQKVKLEKLIGELKGVAGIENDVEVAPGMHRSDNRIARDIIDSLYRISGLDSSDIGVRVDDGRVSLEGSITGPVESAAVERAAFFTRGVKDVVNNLRSG